MNPLEQFLEIFQRETGFSGNKCTFLVGAGVSLESPSNLLGTGQFMRALLAHIFGDSDECVEISKSLDPGAVRPLRFETLMEIATGTPGDEKLEVLTGYAGCQEPNANHYLLARFLALGCPVLTTNFDTLIEAACGRLGIRCAQLVYEADYQAYNKHPRRHAAPLCKLHGSFRHGEDESLDSLKATFSSLATVGELMSAEPQKRRALSLLLQKYPLVVMGYSGSDVFDITPVIKMTPSKQPILWTNHATEYTYLDVPGILKSPRDSRGRFRHPHLELLSYLGAPNSSVRQPSKIHLFDLHTSAAVQALAERLGFPAVQTGQPYHFDWTAHLNRWHEKYMALEETRLKMKFNLWEVVGNQTQIAKIDAIMEEAAATGRFGRQSAGYLRQIGRHYYYQGQFEKSIACLSKATEMSAAQEDYIGVAEAYNVMAKPHQSLGEGPYALSAFGQMVGWASRAIDDTRSPDGKAYALWLRAAGLFSRIATAVEIGYPFRRDFDDVFVFGSFAYDEWHKGIIDWRPPWRFERKHLVVTFNRYVRMHVEHARKYCRAALKLARKHHLDGMERRCLGLFAHMNMSLHRYRSAERYFKRARAIDRRRHDLVKIAEVTEDLFDLYYRSKQTHKAIEQAAESIHIYEVVEDDRGLAGIYRRLGDIYLKTQELGKARAEYDKALHLYRFFGERFKEALVLLRLGTLARLTRCYQEAYTCYEDSLEIAADIKDVDTLAEIFLEKGKLYWAWGDPESALANIDKARKLWTAMASLRRLEAEHLSENIGRTTAMELLLAGARALREGGK